MSTDKEKAHDALVDENEAIERGHDPVQTEKIGLGKVTRKLFTWGVETRGMRSFTHALGLDSSAASSAPLMEPYLFP